MSDYKITLPDGTEVEAPTAYECLSMAMEMQGPTAPVATLGDRDVGLDDLVNAWEQKSGSSNYDTHARAAYCDAAEKLQTVIDEGELMESP